LEIKEVIKSNSNNNISNSSRRILKLPPGHHTKLRQRRNSAQILLKSRSARMSAPRIHKTINFAKNVIRINNLKGDLKSDLKNISVCAGMFFNI